MRPATAAAAVGRPSSSGSSVASSVRTNESFDGILASPASSRTSLESWNSGPRRPDHGWQRPTPIKQYRRKRETGELFAVLPEEVLGLMLDELRRLHLKPDSTSCATCMMRDLCSVSLSARKFLKVARVALYEDIQLVGADSPLQKKRYKLGFGSRLVLLRRTLRSNPELAAMVRCLKAPAVPQGIALDLYQNLVASVVMACPNFERLVGFHHNHDHSFNRLFHALSTRHKLKEMYWTIDASQFQRKRRMSNAAALLNSDNLRYQEVPGDLLPEQSEAFLELHADWEDLKILSIHCLPGATLTPVSLIPDILSRLPSLESLHLSHLPITAFNDANLLSLPSLQTLTLSHLPGVSSEGLSSFARRPSSRSIRKLTLQHVDVDSLPALAQIFSNFTSLETFSLVQSSPPILPPNEMIWLFPYLASPSLRKLHWDITSNQAWANPADSILAKSVAAGGFPALWMLRTPNDPEGIFQALCKPTESIETSSDKFRGLISKCTSRQPEPPATPTTPSTPRTPSKVSPSSSGLSFPMGDQLIPSKASSDLGRARLAAQGRLEAARQSPRFVVSVTAEDGSELERYGLAGFLGQVESQVRYHLGPDPGATDESGGLVDVADVLLADGGEKLGPGAGAGGTSSRGGPGTGEGCVGRWNSWSSGAAVDKKDRDRWWHTERGRWRAVTLS
ncbi:hypothetical protein GGS23DRAFT_605523 [Durotheca rogersii]|uniref:uncharacterized protein n=1 Tax=Durotheca rogersii TaxID=419775 RepID=UPI00221EEA69|nr:uncharacterized protein GGS23DRAFT_605523 [Durotheca rogersii]KAI5862603.1 hypothetical protein GGS23DRAFT_605523 [Durotheca rogersii]